MSEKISDYLPLDEAAETALIARLPDEASAEALVMGNMQNAVKYLSRVCRGSGSEEELVSLAYLAMSKAVKRVRPGKGRFFKYCKVWLRSAVFSAWKTQGRVVRRGDMVSLEQLEQLNEDCEQVETAEHPFAGFDFAGVEARESGALAAEVMARVLTDHEKIVIQLRFTLDYSFEQIAGFLGVTRSASQSSCERALRKIRAEMTLAGTLRESP